MKYVRIDNQKVWEDRIFDNTEDLRLHLIDLHSIDWDSEDDINKLSLDDICDFGDWSYKKIESEVE